MEITLEDYQKAQQIVKNYRVCRCGKLLKVGDVTRTIQYANEHYWCQPCYEKIKNDW